jgi:hypothetical protein
MQNFLAVIIQFDTSNGSQPAAAGNTSIWGHLSDALHQSLDRVLSLLISILPGILAFFVAMTVLALIGMAISAVLRFALKAVKFDDRIARSRGNADWGPATSPTALIARASFWGCILLGLIIGASAFDASYATAAALPSSLLPYLTRVVGAAFLLIAGTLMARYLQRSVLIGAVNTHIQYARLLSLGVKWLVLVLSGAMALDHLRIGGGVVELAFGILFGGIVLTLSLAVGLGSRDLVSRSLESHSEHSSELSAGPATNSASAAADSVRHF